MDTQKILELVYSQVLNTEKACKKAEDSDEQLQLCDSALTGIKATLKAALKGKPLTHYFVLVVYGDTVPELSPAFTTAKARDERARELRKADSEGEDGIYALDTADEYTQVTAYSKKYLDK